MVILNPGTEGAAWYGVLVILSIISSAIAIAPTPIRNITSKDQLKKYRVSVEKFKKHLSNILGNGKTSFFNTSYGILSLTLGSASTTRNPSNDDLQLLAYGNLKIAHSEEAIVPIVVASSTSGIHIATSHVYSVTELSDKLVNFNNNEILNKKNDNEEVTWVSYTFNTANKPSCFHDKPDDLLLDLEIANRIPNNSFSTGVNPDKKVDVGLGGILQGELYINSYGGTENY